MAELSLKKADVQEKRLKAEKQSKMLLDNTRKAISRLTYLKRWGPNYHSWTKICSLASFHFSASLKYPHVRTTTNRDGGGEGLSHNLKRRQQLERDPWRNGRPTWKWWTRRSASIFNSLLISRYSCLIFAKAVGRVWTTLNSLLQVKLLGHSLCWLFYIQVDWLYVGMVPF